MEARIETHRQTTKNPSVWQAIDMPAFIWNPKEMNPSNFPTNNPDERLADFADRVLSGQTDRVEANDDAELRDLEDAILRIHRTYNRARADEALAHRMQTDFSSRLRKEKFRRLVRENRMIASLRNLFSGQGNRMPLRTAFIVAAALAGILIVSILPFNTTGSGTLMGSAGDQSPIGGIALIIGGILILFFIIWLDRRK